jgi:hypothetical protein
VGLSVVIEGDLFLVIVVGLPLIVLLGGLWLAIDRRRSRVTRLLGGGVCLMALVDLGLMIEWATNLCWDEGGTCGQPLDTLFDVMWILWLVLAATVLGFITAWIARSARLVGRK